MPGKRTGRQKRKFWALGGLLLGVVILLGIGLAAPVPFPDKQLQGVTFSIHQAEGLGLDWQETYQSILQDLQVKNLRLSAYWNLIEPADDRFDFAALDYQMDQAAAHDARVVLSVGRKLPRWPECHDPAWIQGKSEAEIQAQVLDMLDVVIRRYQDHPALRMWQLENEPFLAFGNCPPADAAFLAAEEERLRQLDSTHPILITDSGELSSWLSAGQYGDMFGTTMYRTVFSGRTQGQFHYDYIFPAWLYRLKGNYLKLLRDKETLISELQGEPWGSGTIPNLSEEEKMRSFSPERFVVLANFARRTQFSEAFWWGAEYWYWEKTVKDNSAYWDRAKRIFR